MRVEGMCRLFGFRSAASERVHDALVLERNSLRRQSLEHPDGWGIASWQDSGVPLVARGLGAAHLDPEFERVSSAVQARTVLAHLRLASVGSVKLDNAHPFTHGRWAFAHNGTLHAFDRHRAAIEALIGPRTAPSGATPTPSAASLSSSPASPPVAIRSVPPPCGTCSGRWRR
jgi:glutamine amidotransferase